MGPVTRRTGAALATLVVMAVLAAPAAGGSKSRRPAHSDPIAHLACASTGCTEQSTLAVPAGGEGETEMDVLPPMATQASIGLQPTCAGPASEPRAHTACDNADLAAFDGLLSVVADTSWTRLHLAHLTEHSRRIVSCFLLASALTATNEPVDTTADGPTPPLLVLDTCLQLAGALNALEPASGASARCPSIVKSIAIVSVTRKGGAYTAHLKGTTSTPKKSVLAITCRRRGVGMQLTIRPKGRAHTLKRAVGGPLGIAYANPSNTSVGVRTTFKVN